ncbi:MAG TPA: putative porin [Nitrospiria bacterium]|nr:putative porin [Nitrospiria bacterium]
MRLRGITLLVALGLTLSPLTVAWANESTPLKELLVEKGLITKEEASTVQDTVFARWIDRIVFSGDLRLRHSTYFFENNADGTYNNGVTEHRERIRLRIGAEIKMGDVTVGIRLASGTGQQTSTNQTENDLFNGKGIWMDRAYLSWQGAATRWLKITGGKMSNPFFTIYTSDLVWDEDVNPEGFAENLTARPSAHVHLFFNAGQFVLNEVAINNHDPWLLGEQGGISVEPTRIVKATVAAAFYDAVNASGQGSNALGGTVQQGNSRFPASCTATPPADSCYLLNNYRILDLATLVSVQAGPIPIAFMGEYVRNVANTTTTGTASGQATGNEGYQIGAIVGKAAEAQSWEFAYFYKLLQLDATLADLADSDFGTGGTGRRGHIIWAAYNPTPYLQFKTRYFTTKSIPFAPGYSTATPWGNAGDVNHIQVDLTVKF